MRPLITLPLLILMLLPCGVTGNPQDTSLAAKVARLSPTPYMGWNVYYGIGTSFNEQTIREAADAMVDTGMLAAGYRYVWIDGGWWNGTRNADGSIMVDPKLWPSGMAALTQYIHARGLLAGIYTDGGRDGCGGQNQGSEGHERQDIDTFAAWGFDAVKVDYCGGRGENLDPKMQFGKFHDAILNNSSKRPMLLNICNGITGASNTAWQWGAGAGQSWRTSDDEDKWASGPPYGVLNSLDGNARHPEANGPNHWNDPDYLLPELHGLSLAESRSQFSLWSIMAAPLIAGNDIRHMPFEVKQILLNREVIAIDQDPLGIQGTPVAEDVNGLQVWSKRLSGLGARAVALFNRTDEVAKIAVHFTDVGLTGRPFVRDLWEHVDRGTFSGGYSAEVEPHSTVMLKLTNGTEIPVTTLPQKAMTASATGFHPGYEPAMVLDGNVDTFWHSEYSPATPLPQSITLSVGGEHLIDRLRYLPRADDSPNGHILSYRVYVSDDGIHFGDPIASGKWPDNKTEKKAVFSPVRTSFIRLEAVEGVGGFASAAEINVDYVDRSKVVASGSNGNSTP